MERRLLGVFSHPDDESFGPAGTIHSVSAHPEGRVRLVIATRGEAGTLGISKQYAPGDLARIRQQEMLKAARILDVETRFLGYPDRGVSRVGRDLAVRDLTLEIRDFQPHVILTFHPNGISGHPDHKAITGFVRETWDEVMNAAGWKPDRLFYYGITETRAKAVEHFRKIETIPDADVDATLDVSAHVPVKHAACLAHETQVDFYHRLQGAVEGIDSFWASEHHLLAAWRGGRPGSPLADLFQGLAL